MGVKKERGITVSRQFKHSQERLVWIISTGVQPKKGGKGEKRGRRLGGRRKGERRGRGEKPSKFKNPRREEFSCIISFKKKKKKKGEVFFIFFLFLLVFYQEIMWQTCNNDIFYNKVWNKFLPKKKI